MAAIRSRDTKPEIMLRQALFREGIRYRVHNSLTGKPDIVFPRKKLAIFVDGCFWHGCPRCYQEPENNREFWRNKVETNRRRDAQVNEALRNSGWTVIRLWEHDIKKNADGAAQEIMATLESIRRDA